MVIYNLFSRGVKFELTRQDCSRSTKTIDFPFIKNENISTSLKEMYRAKPFFKEIFQPTLKIIYQFYNHPRETRPPHVLTKWPTSNYNRNKSKDWVLRRTMKQLFYIWLLICCLSKLLSSVHQTSWNGVCYDDERINDY